jgi:cysteine synthase
VLGGGQPGPHKVEGIGSSFIPKNFDRTVCDEVMMVTDDQAFGMVKELAVREGVLGGSSSGANVYAAVQIAKRLGAGKRVVTLIPDSAERYLSKKIFEGGIYGLPSALASDLAHPTQPRSRSSVCKP